MNRFPLEKRRYPFRLGCTSYIVPADIIPNAKVLSTSIDDIELVLFESPGFSNIPSLEDVQILKKIAADTMVSYSVHLPIDRKAGSNDKCERKLFTSAVKGIVERCTSLCPSAWILHLEGLQAVQDEVSVTDWKKYCRESIDEFIDLFPFPDLVSIENLGYPWNFHEEIKDQYKMSLCCDIGHLWLYYKNLWKEHLLAMLPATKVIHLHGVAESKDHISLRNGDADCIAEFLQIIKEFHYSGIMTIEVFNETDLLESMEVIDHLWER